MADPNQKQRMEENAARLEALRRQEQVQQLLQLDAARRARVTVRAAEKASGKEVDRASGKEVDRGAYRGAVAPDDILRLATGLGGHFVVAMISPVSPSRPFQRGGLLGQGFPTTSMGSLSGLFSNAVNTFQAMQPAKPQGIARKMPQGVSAVPRVNRPGPAPATGAVAKKQSAKNVPKR